MLVFFAEKCYYELETIRWKVLLFGDIFGNTNTSHNGGFK